MKKTVGLLSLLLVCHTLRSQQLETKQWTEHQITKGAKGHTIHNTQVFSPDDQWVVYDTRNHDTHLARTGFVEKVNIRTGEVVTLYSAPDQADYGPGVGAATYNPAGFQVLFIHGLRNSTAERPYGMTRRTGVMVDDRQPFKPHFLDARDIDPPFTPGALRGGTHAHTWSHDGRYIAFTYNDYVLEQRQKHDPSVSDLRVVGVMAPAGPVRVTPRTDGENHDGDLFSVVVTHVTERPKPGSDEIDKAFDEGWIGTNGYLRTDGCRQQRAIAFQGNVRDAQGKTVTEVFVVDLPADLTKASPQAPLEGTSATRPNPPAGTAQRRITFTTDRPFPGVQGPRHWLRSSPDGSLIFFLMNDPNGHAQIYAVSPNGGPIRAVTHHPFSVQTPFNLSPDGSYIAYGADNSVWITNIKTGATKRLTPRSSDENRPINGVIWSNDGSMLAYNRYVSEPAGQFLQIFVLL
ncbi:DUF3748 domain-containing protein [Nibrella saemangeumensis]|uniref:DUF3748 domain-containing protein n=1 Tax=Nibrella saemangeumensis TaxID=1084526 RepID=A0ABP8NPE9_9BACT